MLVCLATCPDAAPPAFGALLHLDGQTLCVADGPPVQAPEQWAGLALLDVRGSPVFWGSVALSPAGTVPLTCAHTVLGSTDDVLEYLEQHPTEFVSKEFAETLSPQQAARYATLLYGLPPPKDITIAVCGSRAAYLARDLLGLHGSPLGHDVAEIMQHCRTEGPVVTFVDALYNAMMTDFNKRVIRANFGKASRAVFATFIRRHVWTRRGLHLMDASGSLDHVAALALFDAQQYKHGPRYKAGAAVACKSAMKRWGGLPGPSCFYSPCDYAQILGDLSTRNCPLLLYDRHAPEQTVELDEIMTQDPIPFTTVQNLPEGPLAAPRNEDWAGYKWISAECGDVTLLCSEVTSFAEDAVEWRRKHPGARLEVLVALDMEYRGHLAMRTPSWLSDHDIRVVESKCNAQVTPWSSAAVRARPDLCGLHSVINRLLELDHLPEILASMADQQGEVAETLKEKLKP